MQERRHKTRAPVDLNCSVRLQNSSEITAKLIDLNCTGGGILCASPLAVGSHVHVRSSLAGYRHAHHLYFPAMVIHNFNAVVIQGNERQTGYIAGVDFAPLPEIEETMPCDYVDHQLAKDHNLAAQNSR